MVIILAVLLFGLGVTLPIAAERGSEVPLWVVIVILAVLVLGLGVMLFRSLGSPKRATVPRKDEYQSRLPW